MKPSILLVDDEQAVLDSLARHLRRDFDLTLASSGKAAVEALTDDVFAVVMSDLSMPGIDGITVLSHAQDLAPDTTRILLTGHADVDAAARAVNLGQVFRFLTKPVPAQDVATVLRAAVRQHELQTAERVVLEQTLRGSVQTLLDTLALANPLAFARATRVQRLVIDLLDALQIADRWHIEVAAALAHIGAVTLPQSIAEKLHAGMPLDDEETELVAKLPKLTERLLDNIPRLESVREIIRLQDQPFDGGRAGGPVGQDIPFGARVLKVALDADALCAAGATLVTAAGRLDTEGTAYDGVVLRALRELAERDPASALPITVEDLEEGFVLVRDIVDGRGRLLVGAGQRVTPSLIQRVQNFHRTIGVTEPLHVRRV